MSKSSIHRRRRDMLEVSPTELERALKLRSPGIGYRIFRITFWLTAGFAITGLVAGFFWLDALGVFRMQDDLIRAIADYRMSDNSIVYDRRGEKIGEYFDRYHIYVPYEKLPKDLLKAIIATEDRNFFRHEGFDIKGIARAAVATLRGGGYKQGASTITQQVVRNLLLSREKTINRKVLEIALSIQLERQLSKARILELYCNALFLGNGSYGVGAAANRYFGRSLEELESHELALLAGLFQAPSRYDPSRNPRLAKARQKIVIKSMYQARMISRRKALAMLKAPLEYSDYQHLNSSTAPYFIDYVKERVQEIIGNQNVNGRGLRIYTTLDPDLQSIAQKTFDESQPHFELAETMVLAKPGEKRNNKTPLRVEGALLTVDPRSGEILAMMGGREYKTSQFNRTTQAARSPGSAFKPVVYSLALGKGKTWADIEYVAPVNVNGYRPKNYQKEYLTVTTLLRAFYISQNTTAVKLGQEMGLGAVLEHAKALGITSTLKEEPGTVLGSSEVSMLDMATLYSNFSNGGVAIRPVAITKIESRSGEVLYELKSVEERAQRSLSEQVAFLMTEGMRSVLQNGTAIRAADLSGVAAGKTGTSNDSEDNWFCGFTPEMSTIVWVGSDDHNSFDNRASGSSLALPIWHDFMKAALKKRPASQFRAPSGITRTQVHTRFGYRTSGGKMMYFLSGTEPKSKSSDLEVVEKDGQYRDLFAH